MDSEGPSKKKNKNKDDASTSQSSQSSHKEIKDDLKAIVVALGEKVTALSDKFETLNDKVTRDLSNVTKKDEVSTQDVGLDQDDNESFGHLSGDELVDNDHDFDPGLMETEVGYDIGASLAARFDEGLLKPSSWEKSKKLIQSYPRPGNVYALRTPLVNQELLKSKDIKL